MKLPAGIFTNIMGLALSSLAVTPRQYLKKAAYARSVEMLNTVSLSYEPTRLENVARHERNARKTSTIHMSRALIATVPRPSCSGILRRGPVNFHAPNVSLPLGPRTSSMFAVVAVVKSRLRCAGINRHEAENERVSRERSREQSTRLGVLRGESPRAANCL